MLVIGSPAPPFSLQDQQGTVHTLKEYKGRWLVLYFYPKDDTPGCTTEACVIRDNWEEFAKQNVAVVGVSADTVASHQKFKEKYSLPFTLLANPKKDVLLHYEVWLEKSMFGKKYMGVRRASYIVDPRGRIAKVYDKVSPNSHADLLLKDLALLQQRKGE